MSAIDDVLDLTATGTEEQPGRGGPHDDRDDDREQDSSGEHNEAERVDLRHGGMVGGDTRAEVGPKVTSTLGRRRFLASLGLLLAATCAPPDRGPAVKSPPALPALGADPKNGTWPMQYLRAPTQVREAYSWAIAHEATLRFIPCYCGCGADGHTSNYSCYVQAAIGGGRVILDPHGFG